MKTTVTDMQHFVFSVEIGCENSRHFATPLLVSQRNDVRETSAYWRRVTTQIWVRIVPLIGRARGEFASANQRNYSDQGSDASSVWNFCTRLQALVSPVEMSAVYSGYCRNDDSKRSVRRKKLGQEVQTAICLLPSKRILNLSNVTQ